MLSSALFFAAIFVVNRLSIEGFAHEQSHRQEFKEACVALFLASINGYVILSQARDGA